MLVWRQRYMKKKIWEHTNRERDIMKRCEQFHRSMWLIQQEGGNRSPKKKNELSATVNVNGEEIRRGKSIIVLLQIEAME